MRLVRDVGFAQAFSFKYSARPGTPGGDNEAQVPDTIKAARLAALQELLATQQRDFNRAAIGRDMPVLFEKPGRHAASWSAAALISRRCMPTPPRR